jgi:hypothetical protein
MRGGLTVMRHVRIHIYDVLHAHSLCVCVIWLINVDVDVHELSPGQTVVGHPSGPSLSGV